MKKTVDDPSAHIDSLNESIRSDVSTLDAILSETFKGEDRVLWTGKFWGGSDQEIIGYGQMNYKNTQGDVEWFKVGLAVQKNYISLYVNAVDGKQYLTEKYKDKLGKAKVGKSSISFSSLSDIDQDTLQQLLDESRELLST